MSASLAGVTSVIRCRDTCSPSWAGADPALRLRGRVAGFGLVHLRRSGQRDGPHHARHQHQEHQHEDGGPGVASPKGPTVLVEGGTLGDLCDHRCTLNGLLNRCLGRVLRSNPECDVNHTRMDRDPGTNHLVDAFDAGTKRCLR